MNNAGQVAPRVTHPEDPESRQYSRHAVLNGSFICVPYEVVLTLYGFAILGLSPFAVKRCKCINGT